MMLIRPAIQGITNHTDPNMKSIAVASRFCFSSEALNFFDGFEYYDIALTFLKTSAGCLLNRKLLEECTGQKKIQMMALCYVYKGDRQIS